MYPYMKVCLRGCAFAVVHFLLAGSHKNLQICINILAEVGLN